MVMPAMLTRYEQREKGGDQSVMDLPRRHVAQHIAVFMRSLGIGGQARSMLTLAGALADRGHKVDLVVARVKGPLLRDVPKSVRLIDLKTRRALLSLPAFLAAPRVWWALAATLLGPLPVLESMLALVRYLRREQPAVMLSAGHPGNLAALCAIRQAGTPTRLVISQHIPLTSAMQMRTNRGRRWIVRSVRHFYPWADGVVAVSNGVADDLASTTDLDRERITTIYNPVVTPALHEKARAVLDHHWFASGSPLVPVVLGVGRLAAQKDFPTLLKAFVRVRAARQVRLMILGDGEERAALEALVRELGVAADVELPGFVDNPFAYMARAAVFVLSSAYEGFGNVVVEAMACGCPVVSTNCPSGPAEILDGGAYGPLVPVGDDTALAQAILSILEMPPDPKRLLARAALFSVDRTAERYLEVLCRSAGIEGTARSGEPEAKGL